MHNLFYFFLIQKIKLTFNLNIKLLDHTLPANRILNRFEYTFQLLLGSFLKKLSKIKF